MPNGLNCNIAPAVSCILGNYDQLGAANMSAATVLLGLLPTMLSLLACSIEEIGSQDILSTKVPRNLQHKIWIRIKLEVTPSAWLQPAFISFRPESHVALALSWAISIGTVLHIIFRTLSFSALLFIFSLDALGVAGRFLASTLPCRFVLSYEMSGIRQLAAMKESQEQALPMNTLEK